MLIAFNIILDDIVFPDGRTALGVLGGGGPQAAFGMRLFAESVGLVAEVGDDLPESVWAWLRESGIDTTGVRVRAVSLCLHMAGAAIGAGGAAVKGCDGFL